MADRVILLFLCSLALQRRSACFHVLDIAQWFAKGWRKKELIERLERVVRARFDLPRKGRWEELAIAQHVAIDKDSGMVAIEFSRDFRHQAEGGISYSLDVARKIIGQMPVLDVYLWILWQIAQGEHRPYWLPYNVLRAGGSNGKIGQMLVKCMGILLDAWPIMPFKVGEKHYQITCAREDFDRWVFGKSRTDEWIEMDIALKGRNLREYLDYIESRPPWERPNLTHHYVQDRLLPSLLIDVGATVGSPPMDGLAAQAEAAMAAMAAREREMRELLARMTRVEDAERGSDREAQADADVEAEADADAEAEPQADADADAADAPAPAAATGRPVDLVRAVFGKVGRRMLERFPERIKSIMGAPPHPADAPVRNDEPQTAPTPTEPTAEAASATAGPPPWPPPPEMAVLEQANRIIETRRDRGGPPGYTADEWRILVRAQAITAERPGAAATDERDAPDGNLRGVLGQAAARVAETLRGRGWIGGAQTAPASVTAPAGPPGPVSRGIVGRAIAEIAKRARAAPPGRSKRRRLLDRLRRRTPEDESGTEPHGPDTS